jgi:molybdopterin/thiamine biosynthesis adenylyltransferase
MKTVTIVGMGALGSHLLLLARNWKASLRVIDFDKVESKNTQAQFHTKMGMGKNKAKALQTAMQGMWGVKIMALSSKLMGNNQVQLLSESDLIIDCTDNFKARDIIQAYCADIALPCLHGCLSADGTLARIVWTEFFKPDKEDADGDVTCEDGRNVAFHAMAGAVLAQTALVFLEEEVKHSWQLTPSSLIRLT